MIQKIIMEDEMNKKVGIHVSIILIVIVVLNCLILFGNILRGVSDISPKAYLMVSIGLLSFIPLVLILIKYKATSIPNFRYVNTVMFVAAALLSFITILIGISWILCPCCG